jgi:hypothetical protein
MKRNTPTCAPDHECTDEEINAIIHEHFNVRNDPNIDKYPKPTVEDLKHILYVSQTYDGEWYHAEVILDMDNTDWEYVALREQIKQLPPEAGVYASYSYEIDWATEEKLKQIFNQKLSTIEELNNIPAGEQAPPATSTN